MSLIPLPDVYNVDTPWTRQPCDTDKRWRAFVHYRDMDPPRSLRKTAEELGKSLSQLRSWCWQDGWSNRCAEYDRWLDMRRTAAIVAVLEEDGRTRGARHVKLLRDMQDAAAHVVRGWLKRIADNPQAMLHEFSPKDVTQMVKAAITLERLVHGESTQNVDTKHGFDLSRLSVEELDTMRMLEAKASGVDGPED